MRTMSSRDKKGYLFILPFFLVFFVFSLYPIVYTLHMSFHRFVTLADLKFVGFDNYIRLIHDQFFWKAFVNTWIIWVFNFIPQIGFALLLGIMLTRRTIAGKPFFRAVYYLPNLVSYASMGVLFKVLLDWQNGSLNMILFKMGLFEMPVPPEFQWLMNPWFTRGTVAFIQWLMWFGYTMIIMMAGLKAIPEELYEAGVVDGVSNWQEFKFITLPMLRPVMLYITITGLIGGMQMFDIPYVLTNGRGAPDDSILTMIMWLYDQGFKSFNTGYASAVAWGIFAIIMVFSLLNYRFVSGKQD